MPASPMQKLKAIFLGNPSEVIAAEDLLTKTLQRFGLCRIDMLGSPPGMWSLHPPYRSEEFYRRLPEIIRAVETGGVPEGQRGHYDLNDSIIDWTSARAALQRHRRYMRMIRESFDQFFLEQFPIRLAMTSSIVDNYNFEMFCFLWIPLEYLWISLDSFGFPWIGGLGISLDSLAFPRPIQGFSMGCRRFSKKKYPADSSSRPPGAIVHLLGQ